MINNLTSLFKKYPNKFKIKTFKKNEPILIQGNRLDNVYILKEGTVKLCYSDFVGTTYMIDIESSESIFGEIEALQNKPIGVTIIPLTTCKTLQIDKDIFLDLVKTDLDISLALNYNFSNRMFQSWAREMRHVTLPLKYRVLYFLITIAKKDLDVPITKTLLVEGIGSNIRSVNRVLKELVEENLIDVSKSIISIPSLSLLEDYFDNLI
ncbi:Crp/Fnr family transcriptional regulator [uncultured Clostridium sp.]|uniref:Crp/Fnr family transcriptional regulator n=1 Tax=uncultured Clostridium sp. TaxID=59620 RepID=UPI002613904E|nr:Crp/Fnr family transcriptional regulator [uncultured Clostridium sp.]